MSPALHAWEDQESRQAYATRRVQAFQRTGEVYRFDELLVVFRLAGIDWDAGHQMARVA